MDKIEEMAKVIEPIVKSFYVTCVEGDCRMCIVKRWSGECHSEKKAIEIATTYVNAGYCKIPENAVVLMRDEYEKLCDLAYFGNGKETVIKEVLEKVWDATFDKEVGMRWKLLQIAEKYGVKLDRRLKKYGERRADRR